MPLPGAPPPVPPPPTISFQATFDNTGPIDLLTSDPSIAVWVSYADAATPTQTSYKLVPLSQTLLRGTRAVEGIDIGAIAHVIDPVSVTCAIVKIDPATGTLIQFISPLVSPMVVRPQIFYPA
jgi:hypothetical protein